MQSVGQEHRAWEWSVPCPVFAGEALTAEIQGVYCPSQSHWAGALCATQHPSGPDPTAEKERQWENW